MLLYNYKQRIAEPVLKKKIENLATCIKIRPIAFNAIKLFPIDLSIVTGIISAITTYLIVLVQFQFSMEQFGDQYDEPAFGLKQQHSLIPKAQ